MDNNLNPNSMMNGIPPVPAKGKNVGAIIGVVAIVLIIIISALYLLGSNINTDRTVTEESITTETSNSGNTANVSNSTDTESLNADLDAQLKDIDYSF